MYELDSPKISLYMYLENVKKNEDDEADDDDDEDDDFCISSFPNHVFNLSCQVLLCTLDYELNIDLYVYVRIFNAITLFL